MPHRIWRARHITYVNLCACFMHVQYGDVALRITENRKNVTDVYELPSKAVLVLLRTNRIYFRSPMQTEVSKPESERICWKRGLPSFRHYPFTRWLGFLGLRRSPVTDNFLTYYNIKSYYFLERFTFYGGQLRTSFGVFRYGA